MRGRHTALITVPFLLLTSSCSMYANFIESKVCQQYKDHREFGKDSGMNQFAESVQTKYAKYIELP